jgi:hypothetical protein
VASSKRRKNKKLYARRRKRQTASQTSREKSTPGPDPTPLPPRVRVRRPPSELDQIAVFIAEPELGRRETTLAELRQLAAALPFEAAMLNVALLNGRVEAMLNKAEGHWKLAQEFYGGDDELLRAYADVLARAPDRLVFSPQPLTLLMRVLIDDAGDEPMRDLTSTEFATLQRAVLGAHSALESSLDATTWPNRDHVLAYELQAATFFHRPPYLEEMARHDELLRLAADDPRLLGAADRVPVREWLATYGLSANEQWVVGFALSSMTRAFADDTRPNALAAHVDDLLAKMKLPDVPRDLPVLAADRTAFQTAFAELGGGPDTVAWELRPFKRWPFLRMSDGELLLLGRPWLLSWLGEGFHYRAMTHAQKLTPPQTTKYTAYVGQVVERYALDLAEGTFSEPHHVYGEQPYRSKDGDARTSDVALVIGEDLVLFEVHSRRVAATAAVTGDAVAATTEVSRLLVGKVDQLGVCIEALLDGHATLPSVDIADIRHIWPIVVSMGHVMQTSTLWDFLRREMDQTKTRALRDARVQALQILTVADYEKLLGLVCAGHDVVSMLSQRGGGPFRERDFPTWLHGDPKAPSDQPRHPVLEAQWERMSERAVQAVDLTIGLKAEGS